MLAAQTIVTLGAGYLVIGGIIALAFIGLGIDRIDPAAHSAHAFRILILPGLILLWPVVLMRWRHPLPEGQRPEPAVRAQRLAHRRIWLALAIFLPLLVATALLWPRIQAGAPVQLAPAGASGP